MVAFENALLLLVLLTALSVIGRRFPWPMPITYVVGATLAATLLRFPRVELDPGFFFLCFVPPLLFSDGWLMPLRDFNAARRPILLLATGLVVFTTLSAGFVAHWLVPDLPLAMAFALGAVVSPTDAVAVGAITQRRRAAGRSFRLEALRAERVAVDDLWIRDAITDETHRPLQQLLDHEEAMLNGQGARPESDDEKPASGPTA